jgi:hypothetical protein
MKLLVMQLYGYRVEKGKGRELSLIQALEAY